jgi:hypothetical protein
MKTKRAILLLSLGCLLLIAPSLKSDSAWVTLGQVRTTWYAEKYDEPCRKGQTASGLRCVADADVAALGPQWLSVVRNYYSSDPRRAWAFPLRPCWRCDPVWWGHLIRLCYKDKCQVVRVGDTGAKELGVDLPRDTWRELSGEPLETGVVIVELQVLR